MTLPTNTIPIGNLQNAGVLNGSEEVPIVVDNATKRTTTQAIANLAQSGNIVPYEVANLPAGVFGTIYRVRDALAPVLGATVVGGGASTALVWYNGAHYTVIGV